MQWISLMQRPLTQSSIIILAFHGNVEPAVEITMGRPTARSLIPLH